LNEFQPAMSRNKAPFHFLAFQFFKDFYNFQYNSINIDKKS
jgi:hypothetical protein